MPIVTPEPPKPRPRANRPDQSNPEGLPPSKRFRYESPPPVVSKTSPHFPNTLHFVVVGELTPYQADYIQLWARKNPGYTVKVWRDSGSVFENIEFRNQVAGTFDESVIQADNANYEYIRARIKDRAAQFNEIVDTEIVARGLSREDATKEVLVGFKVDTLERLERFQAGQNKLYNRLSTQASADTAEIQIKEIADLFTGTENSAYHDAAYVNNDFQLAENIVRQWALHTEGGLSFDRRSLPAYKAKIFDSVKSTLDSVPVQYHGLVERAKLQACLTAELSPEWGEGRTSLSESEKYPNFIEQLKGIDPVAAQAIQSSVEKASNRHSELFRSLPLDIETQGQRVLLGTASEFGQASSMAIAAESGAQELLGVGGIYEKLLNFSRRYISERSAINKHYRGEDLRLKLASWDEAFALEVGRSFNARGIKRKAIVTTIEGMIDRGIIPDTDPAGYVFGEVAYKDSIANTREQQGLPAETPHSTRLNKSFTLHTEEFAVHGYDAGFVPQNYVRTSRSYDNHIVVLLSDDIVSLEHAGVLLLKDPGRTKLVRWVDSSKTLVQDGGVALEADRNARITLLGHGHATESTIGGLTTETIAGDILTKIIPKGHGVKEIVLCGCKVEKNPDLGKSGTMTATERDKAGFSSFSIDLLEDMAAVNRFTGSVKAPNKLIEPDVLGHKLYDIGAGTQGNRIRKPDLTNYVFERNVSEYGVVSYSYRAKNGAAALQELGIIDIDRFQVEGVHETRAWLSSGTQRNKGSYDIFSHALDKGDVQLRPDTFALVLGMSETGISETEIAGNSFNRIVIASEDGLKINGIKAAVNLAHQFKDSGKWIKKIREHFPDAADAIERDFAFFPKRELAFQRLKTRDINGGFVYVRGNPVTERGSVIINGVHQNPFALVVADTIGSVCGTGKRRRRQVCSPEEIEEQTRETTDSLTLLADDKTRIFIDNSTDDIALHDSTNHPVLEKVQKGLHEFRRAMAAQRVAEHEGYHTYIAMAGDRNDSAFAAVKALAEKEGSKGRALLYDKNHKVLLTEDGRVVATVEGGHANRVSLVGDVTTLEGLDNPALASLVKDVCHSSSVGSLELLALGGNDDSVTRLAQGMAGKGREILDAVVNLSGARTLTPEGGSYSKGIWLGRPAGGEQAVRMPPLAGSDPDGLDVPSLKQQLESNALTRKKLDELRAKVKALPEELRQMDQTTGKQFANKVHEFTLKAIEFNQALQRVYSEKGLNADWTPRLDSLVKQGDVWEMDVYNTKTGMWRHIKDIKEPGIEAFRLFYEDKLRSVKQVMSANEHANPEELHGEFVDGAGWAFALQGFIAMLERHDVAERMDGMNTALRNTMEAHAYVNLLFLARVGSNFILDAGKYAAALHTGVVRSMPERIAGRMLAVSEEVGGAVGKSIFLAAKSIRFAGAVFDVALGLASIGLDIAELVEADDSTVKALAATQLGVDSVSAVIAVAGLVAGLAGAATLSVVLSGVGVIFAGLAVGVTALVGTTIGNIKRFEQVIKLFDQVAKAVDLDVVDDSFKGLNFATLNDGDQHALSWAPVSEINFKTKTLTFGELRLTSVYGGWGKHTPGTYYYLSGPRTRPGETFESIGKVRGSRTARLPDTSYDLVMLPLLSKWEVTGWRYQVIPGAVTRWNGRRGVKFLSAAEGNDFAFNWVLGAFFPWLDLEYGLHEITGMKVYPTHVTIHLDDRNRTLFSMVPPSDLKKLQRSYTYEFYSTTSATYSLIVQNGVTYNIHPSGQDHWHLKTYEGSRCGCLPKSNEDCTVNDLTLKLRDVYVHFKGRWPGTVTVDDHHGEYKIESNGDIGVLDIQITLHGNAHERQEQLNRLLAGAKHDRFVTLNAIVKDKDCCARSCNTGGGSSHSGCIRNERYCYQYVKSYEGIVKNWDDTETGKTISVTVPWAYYLNRETVQPISSAPNQGYYYYAAGAKKIYYENKYRDAEKICLNKNEDGVFSWSARKLSKHAPVTVQEIKGITSDGSKELLIVSENGVQFKLGWSEGDWSFVPMNIHTDNNHLVAALREARRFREATEHVLSLVVVDNITADSPSTRSAGFYDPKVNLAVHFHSVDYDFDESCPRSSPQDSDSSRSPKRFIRCYAIEHQIVRLPRAIIFSDVVPVPRVSPNYNSNYCYKETATVHHQMMATHGAVHSIVRGQNRHYVLLRPGSGRFFVYQWHGSASANPVQVTRPELREVFFYPNGTEPFFIHAMKTDGQLLGYTDKGQVLAIADDNFVALQDRTGLNNYLFANISSTFHGLCGYPSSPQVTVKSATPAKVSLTLAGFDLDSLYSAFDLTRGNRHHTRQYLQHITQGGRKPSESMLSMAPGTFISYSEKRLSALYNATPFNWTRDSPQGLMLLPRVGQVTVERHHFNYTLPDGGSYYIPSLFRIIADTCLRFIGLFGSEQVVGANEQDQIVFYDFSNSSHSNLTVASCSSQSASQSTPQSTPQKQALNPELVKELPTAYLFNPQQLPLTKILWEGSFALGTDNKGYVYRITQTTQSLVGLQVLTRENPSKNGYSLPEVVTRTMLSARSLAQLEPEVVKVSQYMLDHRNRNLPVVFSDKLAMIMHLPGDMDKRYQTWYEPDKKRAVLYNRKAGTDNNVRLLGSGIRSGQTVGYFFAESSGHLYRDGASGQARLGSYGNVAITGNMQVFVGTQGNDTLDAGALLYLDPPRVPDLPSSLTNVTTNTTADLSSYWVYLEGLAGFDEYIVKPEALQKYPVVFIHPSELAQPDSGIKQINLSAYFAHEFKGYFADTDVVLEHIETGRRVIIENLFLPVDSIEVLSKVRVQFKDGELSDLLAQVLVNEGQLTLPLKVSALESDKKELDVKGQQLFIDARDLSPPQIRYNNNDLLLAFFQLKVLKGHPKKQGLTVSRDRTASPTSHLSIKETTLSLNNYRSSEYAQGSVWFAGVNRTRYSLFQYDDGRLCHDCLNGLQFSVMKKGGSFYRALPDLQNKTLWISNQCYYLYAQCAVLVQEANRTDFPLFPLSWLNAANTSLPERFPWSAQSLSEQGKAADINVVMYGVLAEDLAFRFVEAGRNTYSWEGGVNGWVMRSGYIKKTPTTSFGLSLPDSERLTQRYKVVPFAAETAVLTTHNNQWRWQSHYHYLSLALSSQSLPTGFRPEREIARYMLLESFPVCDGIYFTDGLKDRLQLLDILASQPLTIVETHLKGRQTWSATGNILNNIIPVPLRQFGQYTVSSGAGDDLILVNGGIWASRLSFPATWNTPGNRTRNTTIDGNTVEVTELNVKAIPVTVPPPPTGYEVDINPGSGDDIIDVNGAANVRIRQSDGQDTVIVQHFGFADLKALRNGILLLKDIYSTEVQPVLYNSTTNKMVATLAEATEIFLWSSRSDPGRYIAKLDAASVTEIHFADGKQVTKVAQWYEHQSGVEDYDSGDLTDSSDASGSGSGENITQRQRTAVEEVEGKLESASVYALVSRDEPVAEVSSVLNGLDQRLDKLIQEMSSFKANRPGGISPPLTSVNPTLTNTLATPTHYMPSPPPIHTPSA